VKKYALEHNIEVFQPEKIRKDYQTILDKKPDLIVTAAYGQIVGEKLLNAPTYKAINVHGSLLPKHRGGAPIQRAIINGDEVTGITIMYMVKQMDAGDILAQKEIKIEKDETSSSLFQKMSILGRDLLMEVIPNLVQGKITPIPQDESLVTFSPNILSEEEKFDFNQEAIVLERLCRGLLDEPGAYFNFLNYPDPQDKIKVFECHVSNKQHNTDVGKIISVEKKFFTISCGNHTALDIYKVQPVGKKIMNASDFINGGLKKYLKD
jgi:methionyl-tRNA formyltransferase